MAHPDLSNFIGRSILPFMNPRVVCPPGHSLRQGRPNLIVATPMRSGTHVLIDLILNNLAPYRNRPLYVDLDQCLKQRSAERDWLAMLHPDQGYVIKTHYPIGIPQAAEAPSIDRLVQAGIVIAIHRPRKAILKSLVQWRGEAAADAEARFGSQIDDFWNFWSGHVCINLDFDDLFDETAMRKLMRDLAERCVIDAPARFIPPADRKGRRRIYMDKALTRLLGRNAPRINTTIHTLKD